MRLLSTNLERSTAWEGNAQPTAVALLSDSDADVVAVQERPGETRA